MGRNYGNKRNRMEDLMPPSLLVAYSIGTHSLQFENADEQILYDQINKNLDAAEERLDS